jgi:predicted  nucleic acid-binding Zn-ribbon protein
MRDSFIFYRSFIKAIEDQPSDNFKEIIMAATSYALDGIKPELMDGSLKMAFNFMKPVIDSNNDRWETTRAKRAESGRQGGLAKVANARFAKQTKQNLAKVANLAVDVDESVDVTVDVDVDDQADDSTTTQSTTTNSQLIQEIAKSRGLFITKKQADDFHCLDQTWLSGEFNFIIFAAEKICADTSKTHGDHERIFTRAWSYQNLLEEYPAWLRSKKSESIAQERNRQMENAEREKKLLLRELQANKHKACTHCGFLFENTAMRGSCPSCGWDYFLDEDKVVFVFQEHISPSEAYIKYLQDKNSNTSEISNDSDIEF